MPPASRPQSRVTGAEELTDTWKPQNSFTVHTIFTLRGSTEMSEPAEAAWMMP